MHLATHIMSGWCAGNLIPGATPRQRLFCMIAAALPDADGFGWFISDEVYWNWHHKLGHGIVFAVLLSCLLALQSQRRRLLMLPIYFALVHLHLAMDFVGSGAGWSLYYWVPFSQEGILNPWSWEFFSWQNLLAAGIVFAGTVWIALRLNRTPLEALMPSLDRQLLAMLPRRALPGPRGCEVVAGAEPIPEEQPADAVGSR